MLTKLKMPAVLATQINQLAKLYSPSWSTLFTFLSTAAPALSPMNFSWL